MTLLMTTTCVEVGEEGEEDARTTELTYTEFPGWIVAIRVDSRTCETWLLPEGPQGRGFCGKRRARPRGFRDHGCECLDGLQDAEDLPRARNGRLGILDPPSRACGHEEQAVLNDSTEFVPGIGLGEKLVQSLLERRKKNTRRQIV